MSNPEHQTSKEVESTSPNENHQVVLYWAQGYLEEVPAEVPLPDVTSWSLCEDQQLEVVDLWIGERDGLAHILVTWCVIVERQVPNVASKTALRDDGFLGAVINGEMCTELKGVLPNGPTVSPSASPFSIKESICE